MEIEWENGDKCVYKGGAAVIVGYHPVENTIIIDSYLSGLEACDSGELSEPETPRQREERERLEAAYDLYLIQCLAGRCDQFTYEEFIKEKFLVKIWLPIVDKTSYRK